MAIFAIAAWPASAQADAVLDSVTTAAEVIATAADGGGGSQDRDRSGRIGWGEFKRQVSASDSNTDSGRAASSSAFQDSRIVDSGDRLFGFDSEGSVSAQFTDPDGELETEPSAQADSEVTFGFEVVGSPVTFSLTGNLSQTFTATNGQAPHVRAVSPSGTNFDSGTTTEINESGELQPGTYEFSVEAQAPAFNPLQSGGSADAAYDLELRFCTEAVEVPGDFLVGTDGDDVLCGSSEGDMISGRGGKDIIFGAQGADRIVGGLGADKIFAEDGDDLEIYGEAGNDVIDGGAGDDGVGPGFEDVMAGGPGNDELIGGTGDDRMVGRCLEEILGSPSPICPEDPPVGGESDNDDLAGGSGDDLLAGDAGSNVILGGDGGDVATAHGPSVFNLGKGADEAIGSLQGDEIDGGSGNDKLDASSGADCVVAGAGKDDVKGGAGDDDLFAKDGSKDKVDGGAGPDRGRFDGQDRVTSVSVRNLQGRC